MRKKRRFYYGAGGVFFNHCFFKFVRRWRDRAELRRAGISFDEAGNIQLTNREGIHAIIFAATHPDRMNEDIQEPRLRSFNEQMRREFFVMYSQAPKFTIAALEHVRRKVNPMRLFFQNTYEFTLAGKDLDMDRATDGEIARAIRDKYGVAFNIAAVKKERQFLTKIVLQIYSGAGHALADRETYAGKGKK